jgi:hypothetical protein
VAHYKRQSNIEHCALEETDSSAYMQYLASYSFIGCIVLIFLHFRCSAGLKCSSMKRTFKRALQLKVNLLKWSPLLGVSGSFRRRELEVFVSDVDKTYFVTD